MHRLLPRVGIAVLAASVIWLFAGAAVGEELPAQGVPFDVRSILERMERLEKQNEELRKALEERGRGKEIVPASTAEPAPADKDDPIEKLDSKTVRKIIADYLKERDDKKKEEDQQKEEQKRLELETVGVEVGADLKMDGVWRDGLYFETKDKAYRFYVGGRVDFDSTWYSSPHSVSNSIGQFNNFIDPNLGLTDGSDFRRARLRFQGLIYEVVEFTTEVDFVNFLDLRRRTLGITPPATAPTPGDLEPQQGVRFTDVWLGINHLPWVGTFRAGHQKEWITFSNATSGRFLAFMERPLQFGAFNNDIQFSDGFTLQNNFLCDRGYWWVGMFRNNPNNLAALDVQDGDYAYDARLTFLPVWLDDGNIWVHTGADYSYRNLHMDQVRFRGQPLEYAGESWQIPNIVNTGAIFSKDAEQYVNLEYASAWGPLTLTGEYSRVMVPNTFTGGLPLPNGKLPKGVVPHGTFEGEGWYVECLFFLTPDHRGYRPEQPSYDRIRPSSNFFLLRGPGGCPIWGTGAWEVGIRYDYLDLSHHGINGGIEQGLTLGLNWHLNPNAKVQWNLTFHNRSFTPTDTDGRQEGDFWGFGMRFHWDW
jgi:phosphate-selective porin OprO/OprP